MNLFGKTQPLGFTMRFPEGNQFNYFQDMAFWRGVPHGIDFEVRRIETKGEGSVYGELCAPGYGGEPYGNGPLHVTLYRSPPPERCPTCNKVVAEATK